MEFTTTEYVAAGAVVLLVAVIAWSVWLRWRKADGPERAAIEKRVKGMVELAELVVPEPGAGPRRYTYVSGILKKNLPHVDPKLLDTLIEAAVRKMNKARKTGG